MLRISENKRLLKVSISLCLGFVFLLANSSPAKAVDGLFNGKFLTGETDDFVLWLQSYDQNTSPYYNDLFFLNKVGNVGIGTTAPGAKLDIVGALRTTSATISLLGNSGNRIVMTDDSGNLYATSSSIASGLPAPIAGNKNFTLRSDGANWIANSLIYNNGTNVGIGTTTPIAKLDVNGSFRYNLASGVLSGKSIWGAAYRSVGFSADGYVEMARISSLENEIVFKLVAPADITGGTVIFQVANFADSYVRSATTSYSLNDNDYIDSAPVNYGSTGAANISLEVPSLGQPYVYVKVSINSLSASPYIGLRKVTYELNTSASHSLVGFEHSGLKINSIGNIGINMSSPAFKLDVSGEASFNSNQIHGVSAPTQLTDAANRGYVDTAFANLASSTNALNYWTANGNSIFNNNTANVGIGTTAPATNLDITSNSNPTLSVNSNNGAQASEARIGFTNGLTSGNWYSAGISSFRVGAGNADLAFFTKSNGASGWSNLGERMRITSVGNVGIGTTTPGYKLDIFGEGNFNANQIHGVSAPTQLTDAANRGYVDTAFANLASTTNSLNYWTANGDKIFNNNAGNVGIGVNSPHTTLHVRKQTQPIASVTAAGGNLETDWNRDAIFKIDQADFGGNAMALSVSGTANQIRGYIQVGHTSGGYSNLLGYLSLNPFGGNVGIGTISPSAILEINGNMKLNSATSQINFVRTGSTTANFSFIPGWSAVSNTFSLYNNTAGSYSWYVDANQNFVIPNGKLTVAGEGNFVGQVHGVSTPTQLTDVANRAYVDTNTFWSGSLTGNAYNINSGNIGIGTSAPGVKLDLVGAIRTNNQFISTVANGTAPLVVTSNTKVNNLNADLLDGLNSSDFQTIKVKNVVKTNLGLTQNTFWYYVGSLDAITNSTKTDLLIESMNGADSPRLIDVSIITAYSANRINIVQNLAISHAGSMWSWGTYKVLVTNDRKVWIYYVGTSQDFNLKITAKSSNFTFAPSEEVVYSEPASIVSSLTLNDQLIIAPNLDITARAGIFDSLVSPKWYPKENSISALQINKADGLTNIFNVDTINSRIGIGTISPAYKLDIFGEGNFNSNQVHGISAPTQLTDAANRGYVDTAVTNLTAANFWTANGNKIFNNNIGNVGIGTTTPNAKLTVSGGNIFVTDAQITSLTPNAVITKAYLDSSLTGSGASLWATSTSGTYNVGLGNVGIGITSPSTKLEVLTGAGASSSGQTALQLDGIISWATVGSGPELSFYAQNVSRKLAGIRAYAYASQLVGLSFDVGYGNTASKLFIDNSGNIGVSTTSPFYKLDVAGEANFNGNQLHGVASPTQLTDAANRAYVDTAVTNVIASTSALNYWTANGDKIYSNNAGNVGVGTNNPLDKLNIKNTGASYISISDPTAGNAVSPNFMGINFRGYSDAVVSSIEGIGRASSYHGGGLRFNVKEDVSGGGLIERMRIERSGNIGIGTDSPTSKLDIKVSGDGDKWLTLSSSGISKLWMEQFTAGSAPDFKLMNNAGEIARIYEHSIGIGLSSVGIGSYQGYMAPANSLVVSGSLGIGMTNPGYKLDVAGEGNFSGQVHGVSTPTQLTDVANRAYVDTNTFWSGTLTGNISNLNAGNAGIGTTNPLGKVGISQNMSSYSTAFTSPHLALTAGNNVDTTGFVGITYGASSSPNYGWSSGALRSTNGQSDFVWKYHNNTAAGVEIMRLSGAGVLSGVSLTGTVSAANVSNGKFGDNTAGGIYSFPGNVGIGITNPGGRLDVNGGALRLSSGAYLDINRSSSSASGISWYSQTYNAWADYMASPGANMGPKGNLTAPSGVLVNGWALRSFIENANGFGWTFESELNSSTAPKVKFEIRSNDGSFHSYGDGFIDGAVGIGTTAPGLFKLKVVGNAAITGTLQTMTGSDFAEEFTVSYPIEAGTVVVMGDLGYKSVKACSQKYDATVVGIVSDDPSIIAGKVDSKHKAVVAMMGVVKVKVTDVNGKIKKGTLLTTSSIPGYAMKSSDYTPGTMIGKALEDLSGSRGEIKVLVNLQ